MPLLPCGVRGHLATEHVRGVDDGLHLVSKHLLIQAAGDVAVHATGRGELDHVGALRDLRTDGAAAIVCTIAGIVGVFVHHLGDVTIGVVGSIAVAAGDGDAASGDVQRRADQHAVVDAIAQRRDAVDVGAEVAQRREAGFERAACVVDADDEVVFHVAIVAARGGRAACYRR